MASLCVTEYVGTGWKLELAASDLPEIPRPHYVSLWVDRSASMRATLESTGPVLLSFLSDTKSALGTFDISVFFFSGSTVCLLPSGRTHADEVGDWHIETFDDINRLCESIRAQWCPSSTTNVLGAMCKGLACVDAWLLRNATGFATIMITSDGAFDNEMHYTESVRGIPLEHRCSRADLGVTMAMQLSAISVHVALHFVGVNSGAGSAQLKNVRDAFLAHEADLCEPMLHEFGEDTDTHESVRRVFPAACGALTLRVRHTPTSFGYTPVTLHPGGSVYLNGPTENILTIVGAADGIPVPFHTARGVVTDAIKGDFHQAARERAFRAEMQRAIEEGPEVVYRALRRFSDLPSAKVMRQASQTTDSAGVELTDTHITANLRAASSQLQSEY